MHGQRPPPFFSTKKKPADAGEVDSRMYPCRRASWIYSSIAVLPLINATMRGHGSRKQAGTTLVLALNTYFRSWYSWEIEIGRWSSGLNRCRHQYKLGGYKALVVTILRPVSDLFAWPGNYGVMFLKPWKTQDHGLFSRNSNQQGDVYMGGHPDLKGKGLHAVSDEPFPIGSSIDGQNFSWLFQWMCEDIEMVHCDLMYEVACWARVKQHCQHRRYAWVL